MSLTIRLQMLRHPVIAGRDNGGYLERESMMEGVAMSRDHRHEVAGPPGVVCPPGWPVASPCSICPAEREGEFIARPVRSGCSDRPDVGQDCSSR